MRRAALCLSILLSLAGCGTPVDPSVPSPRLSVIAEPDDARPRLWYVGLGLYGESWSENDVAALTAALQRGASGFRLVPAVFSNGSDHAFPGAEPGAIQATLSNIAATAGPQDVILVYVSTHGAPGLLGRSIGDEPLEPIDAAQLQSWLAPLRDHDTVLILSACFSGGFIPPLRSTHRIIFTAARADRTSFGCQAGAEHTVFGDALLGALAKPRESLRNVVAATRATVSFRERALGVDLPSRPQITVGEAVSSLYEAPVF